MANVIIVNTPGPQGQQGIQGIQGLPGPSASFDSISGSIVSTSSFNAFTSSYYETSGSVSNRIQSLEFFSSSLDNTFATDTQLNAATASLSSSISTVNNRVSAVSSSFLSVSSSFLSVSSSFLSVSSSFRFLSSSFLSVSSSYLSLSSSFRSGSFSGSFSGNGSNLTNIPAAAITGLNLSRIATGSITASVSTNSNVFTVESSSNNLLVVSSSGNVGIKTTTPLYTLDVSGSGRFTDGINVTGSSVISGSLTVQNDLIVLGTASFVYTTASVVTVGTSILTLNTDSPAVRFGGISVVDSGSFGNSSTGSLLWDSERNRWVYSNPSGSTYDGGLLISGPRNTSGLGNEQGTTLNAFLKGQGGDHLTSSMMYEVSGNVGIGTSFPTASLHVSGSSGIIFKVDTNTKANTLYVSSSGLIGLGTATPGVEFDVIGSIRSNSGVFTSTTQTQAIRINSISQLQFLTTSSVEVARFDNAGNWGIGTTSPQRRFHIDAASSINTAEPLALTSVDVNNRVGILFASSSLAAGRQHKLFHRVNSSTAEWILNTTAGQNATWYFLPRDDNSFAVSVLAPFNGGTVYLTTGVSQSLFSLGAGNISAQHLNISSSGNVSIGTTSTLYKFNVVDNAATYVAQFRGSNSSYIISGDSSLAGESGFNARNLSGQLFLGINPGGEVYFAGTAGATALSLGLSGAARMRINTSGDIGIGTSGSIGARLHVSGSSGSALLRVDSDATSSILFVSGSGVVGFNQTSSLGAQATFKGVRGSNYTTEINTFTNGGYGLRTDGPVKAQSIFYNSTTGNLYNVSGNPFIYFDSSFNTGIGVYSSLLSRLHVRGSGTTSATTALLIQNANQSSSLVVKDDGNVGIGTLTPSFSLDVSGSGRFTDSLSVTGTITNNGVNIQALSIAYAIALG